MMDMEPATDPKDFLMGFIERKKLMGQPDPDAQVAELKAERIPPYLKIIGTGIPSMEVTSKERSANYYG